MSGAYILFPSVFGGQEMLKKLNKEIISLSGEV
jgi:hypothetical protein